MSCLLLLAAALVVAPGPGRAALTRLHRLTASEATRADPRDREFAPFALGGLVGLAAALAIGGPAGALAAAPLGLVVAGAARHVLAKRPSPPPDALRLAGGWDLLAACLRSGLPVPLAVRVVAEQLPRVVAQELRTIADRVALGADPQAAWQVPEGSALHAFARAARRSAHSGAALAAVAADAAREIRAGGVERAAARAQRAGVLITGPLGLCFLPAFLALGVAPVVLGLATAVAARW
jgi:Flp pilus assembly protein TadB